MFSALKLQIAEKFQFSKYLFLFNKININNPLGRTEEYTDDDTVTNPQKEDNSIYLLINSLLVDPDVQGIIELSRYDIDTKINRTTLHQTGDKIRAIEITLDNPSHSRFIPNDKPLLLHYSAPTSCSLHPEREYGCEGYFCAKYPLSFVAFKGDMQPGFPNEDHTLKIIPREYFVRTLSDFTPYEG